MSVKCDADALTNVPQTAESTDCNVYAAKVHDHELEDFTIKIIDRFIHRLFLNKLK